MIQLVKPSVKYKDSFLEALEEFKIEDKDYSVGFDNLEKDFDKYISWLEDGSNGINLDDDYVPFTSLWLIDNGEYIGTVSIRHKLNERLIMVGGHVGYDIRPSKRKKGYGTLILKLSLPIAKQIGLDRVMLTCDNNNIASWKIMEKNSAVLDEKYYYEGKFKRRYWIDIK
jgi:predicted acetyltransferase